MKSLGGSLAGAPSAVAFKSSDLLHILAVVPGNKIRNWRWDGATWQQQDLPAGPAIPFEGLCAVATEPNTIDVFAASSIGNTPWWWRFDGTAWTGPTPLPPGANLNPVLIAAVTSGPNSIDVFAAGQGNTPNWWHWNGASWGGPVQLPLPPSNKGIHPVRVAAVSAKPNRLDVFAADAQNHLLHWWREEGSGWSVENLGGNLPPEGVSAVSWGSNRIDVFAASPGSGHGPDGNPLQHWWSNGAQFAGPENLGGNLAIGTVSAVSHAPDRLDVFGISGDGRLARWQWDGSQWSGSTYQGNNLAPGDVSAVVRAPHRIDVFARGADNMLRQWPGGVLENATTEPWTNWPGNHGPIAIGGRFRPASLQELVTVVKKAEQQGRRVRAVGSSCCNSDVACVTTSDYLVETDGLNGVVTDVLSASPGILNSRTLGLKFVHVEAGIKLFALNQLLDKRDLAMKTLGGSTGQSLAGALSTGVHGSDFDRGTLPDVVRAIHLVGPGGTQHWIEPTVGITEPNGLAAILGPDCTIHYDDDWFYSAVVSAGSLGIIYSLIIEVEAQYDLIENCEHVIWDTIRESLRIGTPFAGKRALQVVVSQFKHNDGTRPAFLTTRVATAKTKAQNADPLARLYPMVAQASIPVLNANHNLYPDIIKGVLFQALTQGSKQGWAYTVMSSSDEPPAKGLTLEVAFDATKDAYLGFVDAALRILDEAYQLEHLGWGGWISLRFQGHSRAYLAPQHQSTRTCTIEFAAAAGLNSTRPLLACLEAEAKARGGIQHWGMFNDLTAADVERAYPKLDTFRRVRWEITNGGTNHTFDNDFTIRCGLAIPPRRGWSSLGGEFTSGPAVASWAAGRLDIFARGMDNALRHRWWDGNQWSGGWEQLGDNPISSDPAAVSWGPNRIDVFVRGTDNGLYTKSWDGTQWSDYVGLGGEFTSGPAVCSWAVGRLDVFARGTDDALWHLWYDGGWGTWEQLGANPIVADPAAVSWGPNRIDVIVRGTDNGLYTKSWDGSQWSDYIGLGGEFTSGPAVASWAVGRLDVFARGTDNALWHKWWDGSNWSGGWEQLSDNPLSSDPAAVSWGPNRIDVFARGTDDQMYTMSWDGIRW